MPPRSSPHGASQLSALAAALAPALRAIRQEAYYPDPRFHASFAWALLAPPAGADRPPSPPAPASPQPTTSQSTTPPSLSPSPDPAPRFPAIAQLPPTLAAQLNAAHGARLASAGVGAFAVDALCVRIGRAVCAWPLAGRA